MANERAGWRVEDREAAPNASINAINSHNLHSDPARIRKPHRESRKLAGNSGKRCDLRNRPEPETNINN
jgi:hypothetical protein